VRGVVLAGTGSGVGKTVATLAVLRALDDAGYEPQPAKAGPDFIDPSHHEAVVDRVSRSLDPWLAGAAGTRRTYHRGSGDVCVVEGMMGLYDGTVCSTARVAATLELPVVLVVDASAGMESVGATALGFAEYAAEAGVDIDVCGVIAQRAHGGRHESGIRGALPDGIDYLGRVPPDDDLSIPDRHLGLELGTESPVDPEALDRAPCRNRRVGGRLLGGHPLERRLVERRLVGRSPTGRCRGRPRTLFLLSVDARTTPRGGRREAGLVSRRRSAPAV
jgi:cobyrinic acid a,c-diamide synthase